MSIHVKTNRPEYISPDWLRCTDGYAFADRPPKELRDDTVLSSSNLWDRVVCVTLQAQSGDFRNVEALLEVIEIAHDVHIRDCAIRIFAQAAPSSLVVRLSEAFSHSDPDARLEAYAAAVLTCDLRLAVELAFHRSKTQRFERDSVMDAVSYMLEPDIEDLEFADSNLDELSYENRVRDSAQGFRQNHGANTAIYRGAPLAPATLVDTIVEQCREDDPEEKGGSINQLFSIVEAMTGIPYAGCLDDDCDPVLSEIARTVNRLREGEMLGKYESGKRYFFGHPIPDYA